jgi:hypothetical protein
VCDHKLRKDRRKREAKKKETKKTGATIDSDGVKMRGQVRSNKLIKIKHQQELLIRNSILIVYCDVVYVT